MSNYPSEDRPYAWQQPGFMDLLDRSLMPPRRPQPAPKRKKEEKERFYKQVTRRLAR